MSRLIGVIHVAKNQLGMDDDTYRAFLLDMTGKDSCAKMTPKEHWRILEELKRRGFRKIPAHKGKLLVNDPQARKIRALWLTMADCGIVRNRSEKALNGFVRKMTGCTLTDATVKQCQAVIEILKNWLDRCDDPKKRAICLSVLQNDDAPSMLDGRAVVGMSYGHLQ
ncbi:gp16 family protein [uncultured Desulfovibrio sp.]|uniref:gp16 family protein n=1 Tax=uncultured Desulfovibrio sp. TaxID=167968 RepID=UPI0003A4C4EE|nr:regulatory protein GemA [uncultured Desulfovibrio sp.]